MEERLAEEELLALIRRCLDPVEQQALWLRCFERMPVESITGLLGIILWPVIEFFIGLLAGISGLQPRTFMAVLNALLGR